MPGMHAADWRLPSRRRLLQVGSLGMLGLGLPELLWRRGTLAAGAEGRPRATSCIFIVQYGGASHIDTWDPKPHAAAEIRGPYQPIATSVPGTHTGELLPRLATLAHRYCLVRSMTHANANHDGGMKVCMTGQTVPADNAPCFGSVVSRLRPTDHNVPSYVWLQNLDADVGPWYRSGGLLGESCSPLVVGKGSENPSSATFRMPAFDPPEGVALDRITERSRLLSGLEGDSEQPRSVRAMMDFRVRAIEMVTGPDARRAFDIGLEHPTLRERYGRNPLGQNLLLARRLIESGVRLVTVNAWVGVPDANQGFVYSKDFTQGWDHHGADVQKCGIFSTGQFGLGFVLPRFDQAVSTLLEDLDMRGLLDTTLVVVVGEFGRTPKIANNPYPGRDHWPQCYSALLAGAGIRGGLVYGASDRTGAYVKDRPVCPEDFGATLFHALGILPDTRLARDGATRPASVGRPLLELFS
jgi:hypothetical protein